MKRNYTEEQREAAWFALFHYRNSRENPLVYSSPDETLQRWEKISAARRTSEHFSFCCSADGVRQNLKTRHTTRGREYRILTGFLSDLQDYRQHLEDEKLKQCLDFQIARLEGLVKNYTQRQNFLDKFCLFVISKRHKLSKNLCRLLYQQKHPDSVLIAGDEKKEQQETIEKRLCYIPSLGKVYSLERITEMRDGEAIADSYLLAIDSQITKMAERPVISLIFGSAVLADLQRKQLVGHFYKAHFCCKKGNYDQAAYHAKKAKALNNAYEQLDASAISLLENKIRAMQFCARLPYSMSGKPQQSCAAVGNVINCC